jgi:hypothetical protein
LYLLKRSVEAVFGVSVDHPVPYITNVPESIVRLVRKLGRDLDRVTLSTNHVDDARSSYVEVEPVPVDHGEIARVKGDVGAVLRIDESGQCPSPDMTATYWAIVRMLDEVRDRHADMRPAPHGAERG